MTTDPQSPPPVRPSSRGVLLAVIVGLSAVLFLMCLVCAGVLLLPDVQGGREAARRAVCVNNLKRIGIALHAYHDRYDSYPPAYLADADGRPTHSWRVLLLPFFEDAGLTRAYKRYNFDQPWNSEENLQVAERIDQLNLLPYRCPSSGDTGETNYVSVVDPETVWPAPSAYADLSTPDGADRTILLVEVADSGIDWMEPGDLTFERAVAGINQRDAQPGVASHHASGINVLYCDASVHFLPDDTPPETLRALLTASGGEMVEPDVGAR